MNNETIDLKEFLVSMNQIKADEDLDDYNILDFFFENDFKPQELFMPYEFIEEHEQRGDGSGYEYNWVFKRLNDGKYFRFYSYDGRVEYNELLETNGKMEWVWEFDQTY